MDVVALRGRDQFELRSSYCVIHCAPCLTVVIKAKFRFAPLLDHGQIPRQIQEQEEGREVGQGSEQLVQPGED